MKVIRSLRREWRVRKEWRVRSAWPAPRAWRPSAWRWSALTMVVIVMVAAATVLAARSFSSSPSRPFLADATAVPPAPSGMTTVFSDGFGGTAGSGVDSQWTDDVGTSYNGSGCTGSWGTGEVENNTASTANVHLDGNGHLDITPVDSSGSWTSGRIETTGGSFAPPAGGQLEVTASIQLPDPGNGAGYWPAFWMLGAGFRAGGAGTSGTMNCGAWPSVGEIDVMESVNGTSDASQTFHCGADPGGPCNETTGLGSGLVPCDGCTTGYHTYTAIIDRTDTSAEQIRFYLDGKLTKTVTEAQVGASAWQEGVDHGFFLLLDVAMGGGYPDGECGCTSPASATSSGAAMGVGYVAVYQTGTGSASSSPSAGANPAPSSPAGARPAPSSAPGTATTPTAGAAGASSPPSSAPSAMISGGPPATATRPPSATGASGTPVVASCPIRATDEIAADCATGSQGQIAKVATSDPAPSGVGDLQIPQLTTGEWLEYPHVDFGSGSSQFDARVASGAGWGVSGLVEVVLDNPDNPPIGSFAVADTGGWDTWRLIPANIAETTGVHTVYLVFASNAVGGPPYVSLHYFTFPTH